MKIAILTLPLNFNYGGIIQNYALQTALKRIGHDVETINLSGKKCELALKDMPITYLKRFVKKLLRRRDGIIFLEQKMNSDLHIILKELERFSSTHLNLTPLLSSRKDLENYDFTNYDAIIVGSDQVWRAPYAFPDIESYFLNFIESKKIKKIAISASFGSDKPEFTEKQKNICGEYIKDFKLITVREKSALNLINNVYKWQCQTTPIQTLDPTILLRKEEYIKLSINYANKENEGDLFYYILDMTEEKQELINRISTYLNRKPFTVKAKKKSDWYDKAENMASIPPIEEWLQAFSKASFVFTDSFHGSIFSIIFNKDFIAIGNKKRGISRFESLMETFNLSNRLIYSLNDYDNTIIKKQINWTTINSILDREKEKLNQILKSI